MVASIGKIASPSQGVGNFEKDGYYARDDGAHREASAWVGRAASPVAKAVVSELAQRKISRQTTAEGMALSSFDTLMGHLGSLTLNEVVLPAQPNWPFTLLSQPTPLQQRAFELLGVTPIPVLP